MWQEGSKVSNRLRDVVPDDMNGPIPKQCECGGRPQVQKWADGKFWVCCDDRECDRETGTHPTRRRAIQTWNSLQLWFH